MEISRVGFGIAYISLLILLAAREMSTVSEAGLASRRGVLFNTLIYINFIVAGLFMILFVLESSSI